MRKGKLDTYTSVKCNYRMEEYLNQVTTPEHRQALTKLRISAHCLPIEVGRYGKITRENRICSLCNLAEVGDEKHLLLRQGAQHMQ